MVRCSGWVPMSVTSLPSVPTSSGSRWRRDDTRLAATAGRPSTARATAQSARPSSADTTVERARGVNARPAPTTRAPVGSGAPLRDSVRAAPRPEGEKPMASPAVRLRAREAGLDLRQISGSGPAGRITHEDLDAFFARGPSQTKSASLKVRSSVEDIKVVGLRRKIAEKMSLANSRIPHITYVEEVDVTTLEELRTTLNKQKRQDQPKLTLLPFLMRAMVLAIAEQPNLNALFDDEAGVVHQHAGVHIGIAAQTPAGPHGAGGQARRGARSLGLRGGSAPPRGSGEGRHGQPRGAQWFDDYDYLARCPGRRGDDADHQSSGGGDYWRQ